MAFVLNLALFASKVRGAMLASQRNSTLIVVKGIQLPSPRDTVATNLYTHHIDCRVIQLNETDPSPKQATFQASFK